MIPLPVLCHFSLLADNQLDVLKLEPERMMHTCLLCTDLDVFSFFLMSMSLFIADTCPLHHYVGSYTGCVGGCDENLRELLDLKDLTRLPSESGKNWIHMSGPFCIKNCIFDPLFFSIFLLQIKSPAS